MSASKSELTPAGTPLEHQGDSAIGLSPAQIDGLIRLLTDDDPKIADIVRTRLRDVFSRALPQLEARRRERSELGDAVSSFLVETYRERRLEDWERFTHQPDDELDLESGALLIAASEYASFDADACTRRLDELASVLLRRLPATRDPDVVVAKLSHLLFREVGLTGNREDYYDPDNSYLNKVLERGLGIPISLSIVAILVARRVGLELEGVGLPGHFLLRYRVGRRECYVDAFHAGRAWTIEDCLHYLRGEGYAFREEYLRRCSVRAILNRMLANLLGIYRGRGDEERVARATRMLEALR